MSDFLQMFLIFFFGILFMGIEFVFYIIVGTIAMFILSYLHQKGWR